MSSRLFLSLYIVLVFFVVYNCADEAVVQDDTRVENALTGSSVAVKAVSKLIGSIFVGRATNCLINAAVECKGYWKNPKAAVDCAKEYLKKNDGQCLKGR